VDILNVKKSSVNSSHCTYRRRMSARIICLKLTLNLFVILRMCVLAFHFPWVCKLTTKERKVKWLKRKLLSNSCDLNGRTLGFYPDSKVRTTMYSIIDSITGKYCSIGFNPQILETIWHWKWKGPLIKFESEKVWIYI